MSEVKLDMVDINFAAGKIDVFFIKEMKAIH